MQGCTDTTEANLTDAEVLQHSKQTDCCRSKLGLFSSIALTSGIQTLFASRKEGLQNATQCPA